MADLLPEAWLLEKQQWKISCGGSKGPVTNILQCVQCFTTFVNTVATAHYDRAFWRRAEVTKDFNWSVVSTLWREGSPSGQYVKCAAHSREVPSAGVGIGRHADILGGVNQDMTIMFRLACNYRTLSHTQRKRFDEYLIPGVTTNPGFSSASLPTSVLGAELQAMEPHNAQLQEGATVLEGSAPGWGSRTFYRNADSSP